MNVHEIRRKRLKALVRDRYDDSRTNFGEAIDRQQDYVSRLLSEGPNKKNLGEDLARKIERAVGLPALWLDNEKMPTLPPLPYSNPGKNDYPMMIAKRVARMDEAVQLAILNLIETFNGAANEHRQRKAPRKSKHAD